MVSTSTKFTLNKRPLEKEKKKTGLHLISVMLSSSRKKALNKSSRFGINPECLYTSRDEGFDENSVSTSRKKLLPLAGISAKLQEDGFIEQE